MIFTVGVETPDNEDQAFGMIVPALCRLNYGCFSAADEVETEAITLNLESMADDGVDLATIKDKGVAHYKADPEYADFDAWLLVDIDITPYLGEKQPLEISIPEYLLKAIDRRIAAMGNFYNDRSDFFATAAHRELFARSNQV
ncbi:CopG family transcriptional regulator [Rodentibacter trehalosifermentans]|uniref:CopG family transcriptional regulator n=1 Tax=Rodentibacter trehalosifermentans TaxID=1908263 RepID=A0A1V3J0G6_9PAST|nr:type II toxin-antitoxin system HicB family antitoxin [Rodentibacter trehalosifermentans]OOF45799.1 CopG family transcriptional regulator [Rodentibacter trehalosifermentans]OOF47944.1 CopG family transcriptional regulator [Rodentibacter trehalosifermentans]